MNWLKIVIMGESYCIFERLSLALLLYKTVDLLTYCVSVLGRSALFSASPAKRDKPTVSRLWGGADTHVTKDRAVLDVVQITLPEGTFTPFTPPPIGKRGAL